MTLYEEPRLYELAFSYRDVPSEVDAVEAWSAKHRGGRPGRVLELAAGPAAHGRELARRGARVTALDLSPTMCRYAAERAREDGVDLDVVEADMVRFRSRKRFDLAVIMLDSASHLLDMESMVVHLRSVARHLVDDGLYVMEMTHPSEFTGGGSGQDRWRLTRNGTRVDVRWSTPSVGYDPATAVALNRLSVTVTEGGQRRVLTDTITLRHWTAADLDAAIDASGAVELLARYGSFNADAPPFGRGTNEWRMISVVRRVSAGRAGASRPG